MRTSCLIVAFILLVPVCLAGSASNPEILDGGGEAMLDSSGFVSVAVPEIDLRRVWLESASGNVTVTWEVADLSAETVPGSGAVYTLTYRDDVASFGVFQAFRSNEGWRFTWARFPHAGSPDAKELRGHIEGNTIVTSIDGAQLQGVMTRLVAGSLLLLEKPGGGYHGGGSAWLRDTAPDAGYGRDFVT